MRVPTFAAVGLIGSLLVIDPMNPSSSRGATPLRAQPIAERAQVSQVVQVASPPDDFSRLFIVERDGAIVIRRADETFTEFLNIAALLNPAPGPEDGLLGLAFHPNYASNREFFLDYTDTDGNLVVARFTASDDPDRANPDPVVVLLIDRESGAVGHNGGWIAFGPGGFLFLTTGDGDLLNPQDITDNLLGKLLRIDVDGDDFPGDPNRNYAIPPDSPFVGVEGDDEIWAYGLRNPWRCSIDPLNNDLFIADVGSHTREEINVMSAANSAGPNFGWPCMEGLQCGDRPDQCVCNSTVLTLPIFEYGRSGTVPRGCAIIGGEVYRGASIPDLHGTYFFSDFCNSQVWSFRYNGGVTELQNRTPELFNCVSIGQDIPFEGPWSFGRDAAGEIYVNTGFDGIIKIVADAPHPIRAGDPPNNAVDARRPVLAVGISLFSSLDTLTVELDGCALCHTRDTFRIEQLGGFSVPPQESNRLYQPKRCGDIELRLNRGLEVGAWTIVVHEDTGSRLRVGVLPADVDGDGTSNAQDLARLVNALSGIGEPLASRSSDLDLSGDFSGADLLEAVDLLMGYGEFDPFDGASLP